MALINCPECGKEVSEKSKNCYYCGYPLKDPKEESAIYEHKNESESVVMIKCPECGKEVSEESKNCYYCGYPLKEPKRESTIYEHKNESESVEKSEDIPIKSYTSLKVILTIGIVIFVIMAAVFFQKGNNVKNEYYNSENFSSLNKNAYVGGDAYNYIINGTYFTGYSVIGAGCMICATILMTNLVTVIIKTKE